MYKNNFSRKIFWFISCSLYCDVMMPHFLLTDENREDKWDCLSLSLQSFLYQHSTLRSMRSVRVLGILCCPNKLRLLCGVQRGPEKEEGLMNYIKRSDPIRMARATPLTTPHVQTNHRIWLFEAPKTLIGLRNLTFFWGGEGSYF